MLLVDDDQAEPGQRREDRHPRAEHQVGRAEQRGQPVAQPLGRREAAVQRDDAPRHGAAGAEAGSDARLELRRQVDLGHQQQHLPAGVERGLGGAQVDLGLAAAGDAVQQRDAARRAFAERGQRGERRRLLGARRRARRCRAGRCGCRHRRVALPHRLDAPAQHALVERAQRRRQHGQRHLADRALVVTRAKLDQIEPGRRQRRQGTEHLAYRFEVGVGETGCFALGRSAPHHAEHVAPAQRHADQRSGREGRLGEVGQRLRQAAVLRHLDGHEHRDGGVHRAARRSPRLVKVPATLPAPSLSR